MRSSHERSLKESIWKYQKRCRFNKKKYKDVLKCL